MKKAPHLETERLLLTWPDAAQIDAYYKLIVGSAMFDTILWDGPEGPESLHETWEIWRGQDPADHSQSLSVAIMEKATSRYIGGAGLRVAGYDGAVLDVGYALAPAGQGLGYATEAVGALVEEAFANRGAERIFAKIFVGNHASRRVVEKLGFQQEGTLRRAVLKRGVWLDEWLMAITRPDWLRRQD